VDVQANYMPYIKKRPMVVVEEATIGVVSNHNRGFKPHRDGTAPCTSMMLRIHQQYLVEAAREVLEDRVASIRCVSFAFETE